MNMEGMKPIRPETNSNAEVYGAEKRKEGLAEGGREDENRKKANRLSAFYRYYAD